MTIEPWAPSYDYQMNLWAGEIYLDRAIKALANMLEGKP